MGIFSALLAALAIPASLSDYAATAGHIGHGGSVRTSPPTYGAYLSSSPQTVPAPRAPGIFTARADEYWDSPFRDSTTFRGVGGPGGFGVWGLMRWPGPGPVPPVHSLAQTTDLAGILTSTNDTWGSIDGVTWDRLTTGVGPWNYALYQVGIQGTFVTPPPPNTNNYPELRGTQAVTLPAYPSTAGTAGPSYWTVTFDTGQVVNSSDTNTQGWAVTPLPAITPNGIYQQVVTVPPLGMNVVRGTVPAGAATCTVFAAIPAPLDDGQRFTYPYFPYYRAFYLPVDLHARLSDWRALDTAGQPIGGFSGDHPAPWTPAAIPGIQLWFDATALTGMATGDPVAIWPNMAGSHSDAQQGVGYAQPAYVAAGINGRPSVRFDGSSNMLVVGDMSARFPSAALLIIVASMVSATGRQDAYSTGTPNGGIWSYEGSSYDTCFSYARHNNYRVPTPAGTHCYVVESDSSRWRMSVDGTWGPTMGGTFSGGANHRIGVSTGYEGQPLMGDIGEIIAVNASGLSSDDNTQLGAYIFNKWGVPSTNMAADGGS